MRYISTVCMLFLLGAPLRAGDICSLIDWFGAPGGPHSSSNRFTVARAQVQPLLDHPLKDPSI